jgi:histidyl-tRNA synthetase
VPATGFSIGVSRLLAALKAIGSPIVAAARKPGPVVVLAMDRDQVAAYQTLVSRLRAEGIAAEMYLGEAGMNPQLKYADRRGAVCVVIQGSNEREKGEVAIKDLVAGAELAKGAKTLDRDAYLALKEKAQIVAPRGRSGEGRAGGAGAPRVRRRGGAAGRLEPNPQRPMLCGATERWNAA